MNGEFIDPAARQQRIEKKTDASIKTVLNHGSYIMGPDVKAMEDKISGYVEGKQAIDCASRTDAVLKALMAYNGRTKNDAKFASFQ